MTCEEVDRIKQTVDPRTATRALVVAVSSHIMSCRRCAKISKEGLANNMRRGLAVLSDKELARLKELEDAVLADPEAREMLQKAVDTGIY